MLECPLVFGRQRGAGGHDALERLESVGGAGRSAGLECCHHRAGERVAHDRQLCDVVLFDQSPQLVGVEPAAPEQHHRAAHHECRDGEEQRSAVHERRSAEVHRAAALGVQRRGDGTHLIGRSGHLESRRHVTGEGQRAEQIDVAPHDALGQPGGAAGVEEQQIVARPLDGCRRIGRFEHVVVPEGAVEQRCPVVDLQQQPQVWCAAADVGEPVGQRAVEHQHLGVGVGQDVGHLVGEVAVVHVHRGGTHLERGEHRLDVLRAVVEQLRHLAVGADAVLAECAGQPCRPVLEVAPAQLPVAHDDGHMVGLRRGERLPQGRPVLRELCHRSPSIRYAVTGRIVRAPYDAGVMEPRRWK